MRVYEALIAGKAPKNLSDKHQLTRMAGTPCLQTYIAQFCSLSWLNCHSRAGAPRNLKENQPVALRRDEEHHASLQPVFLAWHGQTSQKSCLWLPGFYAVETIMP